MLRDTLEILFCLLTLLIEVIKFVLEGLFHSFPGEKQIALAE